LAFRYCERIGTVLKDELGELCADWEKLEDQKMVPLNILP
jgi:hypothetical protein